MRQFEFRQTRPLRVQTAELHTCGNQEPWCIYIGVSLSMRQHALDFLQFIRQLGRK